MKYIELLVHRQIPALTCFFPMLSLRKGFCSVVSNKCTSILEPDDVVACIYGSVRLNLEDMKKYVHAVDFPEKQLGWFWEIVQEMTQKQQKELLLFWSGSEEPPLFWIFQCKEVMKFGLSILEISLLQACQQLRLVLIH
eukprot:TRINITY_DN8771_c0_g1_i1.p1 TRINITY_DN8771_c0_g1~~TRINITY_DN8771_c0_g1_i1.p1  ORF type:complete len:139 (-),score=12.84 TRINITY_DN8771_c0_g1_i1:25-441(-)